jgi:uncharacterized protein (DUF1697 family)
MSEKATPMVALLRGINVGGHGRLAMKDLHVTFAAAPRSLAGVDLAAFAPEEARVIGRELYLHLPNGMGRSKLAELLARRAKTGEGAETTRNWRTITTLLAMCDALG